MNKKLIKISSVAAFIFFMVLIGGVAHAATPACGSTITENTTLDADMTCPATNGINISANNIVLDCAGHSITGSGSGYGIYLSGNNSVIKNCKISGFQNGVYLDYASGNTISNVTANSNTGNPGSGGSSGGPSSGFYLNSS